MRNTIHLSLGGFQHSEPFRYLHKLLKIQHLNSTFDIRHFILYVIPLFEGLSVFTTLASTARLQHFALSRSMAAAHDVVFSFSLLSLTDERP